MTGPGHSSKPAPAPSSNRPDYPAAAASHQQALALFSDRGNLPGHAEALNRPGELTLPTPATQ